LTLEDEAKIFFRYIAIGSTDLEKMGQIRAMGLEFSLLALDIVPAGQMRADALQKLREVVLELNAEIGHAASIKRGL
jgi:hypothetical protein